MMIVMKSTATEDEIQAVIERIESCGARAHPSRGEEVTVIGAVGDREHVQRLGLEGHPGVEQVVQRRRRAALDQRRAPAAADLGQQREVLHVARADLDHVGDLEDRLDIARVHQLGDDRQAGLGLGLGEDPQARFTEALEAVRARAGLVGAAAQHGRAGRGDALGGDERLRARLDRARAGDQHEAAHQAGAASKREAGTRSVTTASSRV